jgi:dipeptidyl aminopeptidase/acylaminoacyl peptidase
LKKKDTKKPRGNFKIEELASIPTFAMATLNYAKDTLAFYWNKTGRFELYTMNLETKEITQISDGQLPKGIRAGYLWGRDDRTIYFTKDNDGDEKHDIYSIDIVTKVVTQLSKTPDAQDIPSDVSPDGKWLLFNANRDNGQMNLYRMHLLSKKVEQLTNHTNPATGGEYSKDGLWIAYTTNEEKNLVNDDIYLIKSDGSDQKRVVQLRVGSRDSFSDWSEDGSFFVFTTDVNGNNQVGMYHLETEEITLFGDGTLAESASRVIGNDKILAVSNQNASLSPVLYDVKTKEKTVLEFPPGIAIGSQLINDHELIITINRPVSPSTLIRFDMNTEESEILLETDMGNIDGSLFVDGEHIFYPSLDGTEIPAIVYKPRDFDPSKKYPAIVIPHGGPTGQYFLYFTPSVQYLTDLGYVVMNPNVRGSTGYGSEFRDACIKDWGGKDHDDWIAGREWLIQHASVDPKKVVIYGGSYGGYATLWAMGKSPELWAAGIAWVPVSDLVSMYELSMEHFKFYLRQQMGDPVEDKELWIDRSPLTHIQHMKSPLLLVHGTNDPRCPVSQSHLVVEKLKKHGFEEGKDFEYVEYGDEGHGSSGDMSGAIRSLKLLDDFLYRRIENN